MSAHFTPQGPFSNGGAFTAANANNIETGIGAVDNAKLDLAGGTVTGLTNFTGSLQKGGKNVFFAQAGLTGKFSAQTTAPTSPADGDLWLDTSVVLS